jgi:tRNA(Arg) A34 adenosine deaminase TadA
MEFSTKEMRMYDTKYMRRVLELAQRGMDTGHGGPFGSVIVKNGEIVGEAHNEVLSSNDPTAHAELLAVRRASARLKTFNLSGCELYTNGAPCCMCMSSMLWARLDRVYYTLSMEDSRDIGLGDEPFYEELARPLDNRQIIPMVQNRELADDARTVYEAWVSKPNKVAF